MNYKVLKIEHLLFSARLTRQILSDVSSTSIESREVEVRCKICIVKYSRHKR